MTETLLPKRGAIVGRRTLSGWLPAARASSCSGKGGSEMGISGQLFQLQLGRTDVTVMVPAVRVTKRGLALLLDTVFEITHPFGIYTIIDAQLLGFGVSITLRPKGEQSC